MKKRLQITGVALSLAFASLGVFAYPNLNATTGILAVPTAETVSARTAIWAGDALFMHDTTLNARFIYGLTENLEVGAGVIAGADTAIGLTAKYHAPTKTAGYDWALGASVITGNQVGDGTQIFLSGTRPFGVKEENGTGLKGTIGLTFTDIDSASAFRPFVGAQLRLDTKTEVAGEFVLESGDFGNSIFSLLLRQQLNNRLTGQLGFTNAYGFTGAEDSSFFIGAAYALR